MRGRYREDFFSRFVSFARLALSPGLVQPELRAPRPQDRCFARCRSHDRAGRSAV